MSSLSAYARQFLERLPRPDVDFISNLPPAIAIERRNRVTNARSTVGTATEILDFLRLLYAKIGETWCRDCDRRVLPGTVESIVDAVVARFGGRRVAIAAPLPAPRGETVTALRERLLRDGFTRLLGPDGAVLEVGSSGERAPRAVTACCSTSIASCRARAWDRRGPPTRADRLCAGRVRWPPTRASVRPSCRALLRRRGRALRCRSRVCPVARRAPGLPGLLVEPPSWNRDRAGAELILVDRRSGARRCSPCRGPVKRAAQAREGLRRSGVLMLPSLSCPRT